MSAQDGGSLALLYRPQGPQQAGGGIELLYGGSVAPLRKRISTGFSAPWHPSQGIATATRAPFSVTAQLDPQKRGPWAKGVPLQSSRRAPFGVSARSDAQHQRPWGRYARRVQEQRRVPWGSPKTCDEQSALPWGVFGQRLANLARAQWGAALARDFASTGVWGECAGRPVLFLRHAWPLAVRADNTRTLPWNKYSRQLAPGWGVVVPDGTTPVDENGTVIVPIRRAYIVINSLSLVTIPGGDVLPATAFSMGVDADSWTWQWSATLHASALPLITPEPGGDPVELQAAVNGQPFRLTAEGYSRQRQFGSARISVRGRGRAAILDAPCAPVLNHGNAADRTAQQLANEALTINGVSIGWAVDWGLTDWLVPGGAWSHQGTYISAILDIAGAAGGYVQPHDTDATLRILPRYPQAPWDWAAITPDFELPAAAVAVEGTEWLQMPAYNRVHVSGTGVGVLGEVTRAGTAGDVVAPMVTHPLITHADAARQRGIAELSNTGRIANLSLRLQVLAEIGVIKPGAWVRYVDNAVPTLGLVRGVQLEWAAPTLRQTITVETHP